MTPHGTTPDGRRPDLALPDAPALTALGATIEAEHQAASRDARAALGHALECGRLLLEAKAALDHGAWLPWLATHTTIGVRQAQRYMRLAHAPEALTTKCDAETHLTITQALADIATPRSALPPAVGEQVEESVDGVDDLWAWAEAQLSGPFNRWDFADESAERCHWLTTKLLHALAIPVVPAFLIGIADMYKLPAVRLARPTELMEALRRLGAYAQGTAPALPIDAAGMSARDQFNAVIELKLNAQRAMAFLFEAMDHLAKQSEEERDDEWTTLHATMMARIDRARERLEEEREAGPSGPLTNSRENPTMRLSP